ncbi:hypothetical protein M3N64_03320 [Sporolactobacillus sp. CPB3-1]|uniref:DUF1328 domain-containing protein n=1 Tax=Sporolactobacillus mangiferae TaxID=2940498 RepID=A0ABT0M7Y0_9BACL|nr:hypothetical protein [Sporolactobacillus mangiferae]MCL1630975.1 hypothetical protein [Sporolactobacillus mangiferae]
MRALYFFTIFLVAISLIVLCTGMVTGNPLMTLLSAFAVILFMWIGFMLKAAEQRNRL